MFGERGVVVVPKRKYVTSADLELLGVASQCSGYVPMLRGTARQSHSESFRKRMRRNLNDTLKAEAAEK